MQKSLSLEYEPSSPPKLSDGGAGGGEGGEEVWDGVVDFVCFGKCAPLSSVSNCLGTQFGLTHQRRAWAHQIRDVPTLPCGCVHPLMGLYGSFQFGGPGLVSAPKLTAFYHRPSMST